MSKLTETFWGTYITNKKLDIIQFKTCHTKHFQITGQNTVENVKKGHLDECLWSSYTGSMSTTGLDVRYMEKEDA